MWNANAKLSTWYLPHFGLVLFYTTNLLSRMSWNAHNLSWRRLYSSSFPLPQQNRVVLFVSWSAVALYFFTHEAIPGCFLILSQHCTVWLVPTRILKKKHGCKIKDRMIIWDCKLMSMDNVELQYQLQGLSCLLVAVRCFHYLPRQPTYSPKSSSKAM